MIYLPRNRKDIGAATFQNDVTWCDACIHELMFPVHAYMNPYKVDVRCWVFACYLCHVGKGSEKSRKNFTAADLGEQ